MAEDRPRLRNLEAFPVEQDGERVVALRDPSGFTDQVVALPMPLLEVVSLFDGEHSLEQIHAIVKGRHGEAPTVEQIASIARSLDDNGFLDSPKFAERQRADGGGLPADSSASGGACGRRVCGRARGPGGADRRLLHPCRRARVGRARD